MEVLHGKVNSWSTLPTVLLGQELAKRQEAAQAEKPQCGSGKHGVYDTTVHVLALLLILVLSTLSCGLPLLSHRSAAGKRQRNIIFLCQHFGTGVLLATAFVHLLPTAFMSLTDPCLPYVFSQGYKPFPGLIAMVSALVVVALESFLSTRGARHSHSHHHMWAEDGSNDGDGGTHAYRGFEARRRPVRPSDIVMDAMESRALVSDVSPLPVSTPLSAPPSARPPRKQRDDCDAENERLSSELDVDELQAHASCASQPLRHESHGSKPAPGLSDPPVPVPEEQKRLLLQCLLLEAGILFHSVFIGVALSVATGPSFAVFLVAIAFHQTFEGMALGTRIAAVHFPRSSPRPWLMVLAFGLTTPLGQAVGLLVHKFYDPMSQTGLLMVGFMNAISSGLLLFAGLVQLLAEDFLSKESYQVLQGRRRLHAFLAVLSGAGLMALVGAIA